MFTDITGDPIEVGDIIVFTQGAGQQVSSINFGKVTRFSKKSLWVQELNPHDLSVRMVDDGYMEDDGPPVIRWAGRPYEYEYQPKKFVKTGERECDETIINSPRANRFYKL